MAICGPPLKTNSVSMCYRERYIKLLCACTRYVGPLLVAATFAGALKQVLAMRQWSAWITPASGVLLLSGGTYTLLSRLTA